MPPECCPRLRRTILQTNVLSPFGPLTSFVHIYMVDTNLIQEEQRLNETKMVSCYSIGLRTDYALFPRRAYVCASRIHQALQPNETKILLAEPVQKCQTLPYVNHCKEYQRRKHVHNYHKSIKLLDRVKRSLYPYCLTYMLKKQVKETIWRVGIQKVDETRNNKNSAYNERLVITLS